MNPNRRVDLGVAPPVHDASTYRNWLCRCDVCKAANAAYVAGARHRRWARLRKDPTLAPHGESATYTNWMCRCRPCKDAHNVVRKAQNARKRNAR